ncbi:MAG: carboxyl transferase domain-containing protein [Dehalococcoidales bacterium]|nr:carboxyl transferase domain-containing protein [Dehalococcoidales bacterium]
MSWQKAIDEMNEKKRIARQMGGPAKIAQQHAKGRLTVRERIDHMLDDGSFHEIGTLAGKATYDSKNDLKSFVPSSVVTGFGKVDSREVCILANDFTIKGGSTDDAAMHKQDYIERMAIARKMPLVCLYEGAGGSVTEGGDAQIVPVNFGWAALTEQMYTAPLVAANLGTAAGWIAVQAAFCHFNVMTKSAEMFVAGPPLVKRALDIDIDKHTLGDYKVHVYESGVVDNVAEDEEDAFRQIRQFLSYLPQNVWHQPPRMDTGDDPNRREEELISIVPEDPVKSFNVRKMIKLIADKDSTFEIAQHYGKSVVTMLARIDGYPVAIMSNDSRFYGGATDVPGAEKMLKFIDLADTFHIPTIYMMDVPGFMIGPDAERTGPERKAVRVHAAMHQSTVPWASIIVRRCFGVAGSGLGPYNNMLLRYSWPSGKWGSLPTAGGALAEFRREIEAAADPEAKRLELEALLKKRSSPLRSAVNFGLFGLEDIIDPRDTRAVLVEFVRQAQEVTRTQVGRKFRGMRP